MSAETPSGEASSTSAPLSSSHPYRLVVAGQHGVQQRGEATRRPRRIGLPVARELRRVGRLALPQQDGTAPRPPPARHEGRGRRTGVDERRAVVDQRLRHAGMRFGGGPHQRGMPAGRPGVRIHARRGQPPHDLDAAGARGEHEGRIARGTGGIRIGARREEQLDQRQAAVGGRQHQRRHAQVVRRAGVGAGPDQFRRQVDLVPVRRPGHGRGAVALRHVHVAAGRQQPAGGLEVPLLHRVHQSVAGTGGRRG